MNDNINKELRLYGDQVDVPGFGTLRFDFSMLVRPYVDTKFVAIDLNGTFFDPVNPEWYPLGEPELLPMRDLNGRAFQGFLTDFSINTMLRGATYRGRDIFITDFLSKYFGITLRT